MLMFTLQWLADLQLVFKLIGCINYNSKISFYAMKLLDMIPIVG